MKAEKFDATRERLFLSHLIYSTVVLEDVVKLTETRRNLLRSPVENMLLEWCVNYYRSHGKAPDSDIQWILSDYSDSPLKDELGALVESIPRVLAATSSSSIFTDMCNYLDKIALERVAHAILSRVSQDDVEGGVEAMGKFSRISFGVTTSVNPFTDKAALIETFSDDSCKSLLAFSGWDEDSKKDAQSFFGDTFSRSCFVVFNAPEKGCKSATLLEIAVQALKEGKRVAYFEAGDMSRPQVFRRLYQRIAHHPRHAGTIYYPDFDGEFWVEQGGDDGLTIKNDLQKETFKVDLSLEIAEDALKKWNAEVGDMSDQFRFSDHPQDLTVPMICSELDEWERQDGFRPDFVIIDYADILLPVIKNEFRHQINDTFARLRALSLDRKCCLVTATQAKGSAYNAETQSRTLISEDKRKAAYPTAMIGIASVEEEREKQVYHMNYVLRRDGVCVESQKIYFAQCLAVGNPMVRCYFPVNHYKEPHGQLKKEIDDVRAIQESLSYLGNPDEFEDETPIPGDDLLDYAAEHPQPRKREPLTVNVPGEKPGPKVSGRFKFPPPPDLSDDG